MIFKIKLNSNSTNLTLNNEKFECNPNKHTCGVGGIFPFGFYGVIKGAAKCFYAYIGWKMTFLRIKLIIFNKNFKNFLGFDTISTTGEEVKNPKRALPLSIIMTLIICTVFYLAISTVLTLMVPYYLTDPYSGIMLAFQYVQYDWAKYIIASGAIISLLCA